MKSHVSKKNSKGESILTALFGVALSLFEFEEREMSIQTDKSSNIIMTSGELVDFFGQVGHLKLKSNTKKFKG